MGLLEVEVEIRVDGEIRGRLHMLVQHNLLLGPGHRRQRLRPHGDHRVDSDDDVGARRAYPRRVRTSSGSLLIRTWLVTGPFFWAIPSTLRVDTAFPSRWAAMARTEPRVTIPAPPTPATRIEHWPALGRGVSPARTSDMAATNDWADARWFGLDADACTALPDPMPGSSPP